jgi:hypothetical protein
MYLPTFLGRCSRRSVGVLMIEISDPLRVEPLQVRLETLLVGRAGARTLQPELIARESRRCGPELVVEELLRLVESSTRVVTSPSESSSIITTSLNRRVKRKGARPMAGMLPQAARPDKQRPAPR